MISLDVGVQLRLSGQVNYYDVSWGAHRNFEKLIEPNLLAIAYRGVEKVLELYADLD